MHARVGDGSEIFFDPRRTSTRRETSSERNKREAAVDTCMYPRPPLMLNAGEMRVWSRGLTLNQREFSERLLPVGQRREADGFRQQAAQA